MSTVGSSAAQDFLSELAQDGTSVTWKQRTVTGKDAYGQPIAKFTGTQITVIMRLMRPADVKLVDAGFQLQHYLWCHYAPSVSMQMLDRIAYSGTDYEVRLAYPYLLQGVAMYGVALLRIITE